MAILIRKVHPPRCTEALKSLIVESVLESLNAIGFTSAFKFIQWPGKIPEKMKVALIDYSGRSISGHVGVSASDVFLKSSLELKTDSEVNVSELDLQAWLGELTSDIAEKLKSKFEAAGFEMALTRPYIIEEQNLILAFSHDTSPIDFKCVDLFGNELFLHFTVQKNENFERVLKDLNSDSGSGKIILFK